MLLLNLQMHVFWDLSLSTAFPGRVERRKLVSHVSESVVKLPKYLAQFRPLQFRPTKSFRTILFVHKQNKKKNLRGLHHEGTSAISEIK